MITTRIGAKIGSRIGAAIGVGEDEIDGGGGTPSVNTTLAVTIADSVDPVITSVNFSYAVVVTNTGAVDATNVQATITLDGSLVFVGGSGTGWVVTEFLGIITATRGTLAVGAAPTITITVTSGVGATSTATTADAIALNAPAATQDIESTVVKLVSRDATSLVRCPANATEWSDFTAYHVAIGTTNFPNVAPSMLRLYQEASGNAADSIGSFTGTASGVTLTYQSAITGWTRKGILGIDGGTGKFATTSASLPNPATNSLTVLSYFSMPTLAPLATRVLQLWGTAAFSFPMLDTTPRLEAISGANTTIGGSNPLNAVRPIALLYDVTNNRCAVYSDQEKIAVTRAATTGKSLETRLFMAGAVAYEVAFHNAAAELSDNQVRALLVALNWTIAW